MYGLADDATLPHILANNASISPTAHHALSVFDKTFKYSVGTGLFTTPGITWESQHPWERMLPRLYRMWQADIQTNAPKDRTLFDWR